jgi:hypothetical protein
MNPQASPEPPYSLAAIEGACNYFETETHYFALANQIVNALRTGGRAALVTGVRPAGRQRLSRALCNVTEPRRPVIDIRCGPELTSDELSRAGSVVATLPTGSGAATVSEAPVPLSSLIVFDGVDDLSELQLREILEFVEQGARKGTAAVLLASSEFLTRLENPSLQFLRDGLAARLEFQEVGQDEGIEFLRYQLAARHETDQTRGISHGVFRILRAACVLLTLGVGAFWLARNLGAIHELATSAATDSSSAQEQSAGQSTASTIPAGITRVTQSAPVAPAVPPIAATPQTYSALEPEASADSSAAEKKSTTPEEASRVASLSPTEDRAAQRQGEISALVARGDSFIGAGDIASARLFYERAADAGDGSAALRLGATFDPGFLAQGGVRGIFGDRALALSWYRRARDLGNPAAAKRLKALEEQQLGEPNSAAQ